MNGIGIVWLSSIICFQSLTFCLSHHSDDEQLIIIMNFACFHYLFITEKTPLKRNRLFVSFIFFYFIDFFPPQKVQLDAIHLKMYWYFFFLPKLFQFLLFTYICHCYWLLHAIYLFIFLAIVKYLVAASFHKFQVIFSIYSPRL